MLLARESHGQANWLAGVEGAAAPVRPHLAALAAYLAEETARFEPEVRHLVEYTLVHSGKRIRPALVFFAGWRGPAPDPVLVRAAAVVEFVHLATLVHDDILDEAKLRHKSETVSARHGPAAAVLLGDALFAHAVVLAAEFPGTNVSRAVAEAARRVCAGEIFQTFHRGEATLALGDYFRVIDYKTAELFRVSCVLGAELAGYPAEFAAAAGTLGRGLGLGYQIFDDLIDFLGDEASAGKTLGTDLASGKFTLPALLFFQEAGPAATEAWRARLAAGGEAAREFVAAVAAGGHVRTAHARCLAELDAAEAALAPFADLPPAAGLLGLVGYVRALAAKLPA